jgi:SAM-dependent methyltransferase
MLFCLIAALGAGGLATLYVNLGPGPLPRPTSPGLLAAGALVALLTLANLFVRFGRWQFALRRLGESIPAVQSLAAFVGSFALLPVPLLVGQLAARRRLLPENLRPSSSTNVLAFVWERLLDLWALAVLSALFLSGLARAIVLAAVLSVLVPRVRSAIFGVVLACLSSAWGLVSPAPLRFDPERIDGVLSSKVVAAGAISSLVAWTLLAGGLALLGASAGVGAGWWDLTSAGAASILIGGLSLLPMGVAVSGFVLLRHFDAIAAPAATAIEIVFVYRVATVWFSVALGAVALAVGRRYLRRFAPSLDHFDSIDHCYDSWVPPHYRDHVVDKKIERMRPYLETLGASPLGLDIGCGRGWYLDAVTRTGARAVGTDLSHRQLAAASEHVGLDFPLCQASLLRLPFRQSSYDFAYTINVVHHLRGRSEQQKAFEEIARVLRPGGLLFLHEMNIRNPLFRGYISYVFPILKGIDEGIEHFLHPERLPLPPSLELVSVDYFTFVPDLCPEPLLPILSAIESRLEKSPLAPLGVHFLAVLRHRQDPPVETPWHR